MLNEGSAIHSICNGDKVQWTKNQMFIRYIIMVLLCNFSLANFFPINIISLLKSSIMKTIFATFCFSICAYSTLQAQPMTDRSGVIRNVMQVDGVPVGNVKLNGDLTSTTTLANFSCGQEMSHTVYDMMKDVFKAKATKRSFSVLKVDYNNTITSTTDLRNGYIKTVVMPELDAASKDMAEISFSLVPEAVTVHPKSATKVDLGLVVKQKEWLKSNFKFSLDGYNDVFARTSKVSAISVKLEGEKDYMVNMSNIVVTCVCNPADADKLNKWVRDCIVKGNSSSNHGINGSISYLAADLKKSFFTVNLYGAMPFKITSQGKTKSGMETLVVELSCTSMHLDYSL